MIRVSISQVLIDHAVSPVGGAGNRLFWSYKSAFCWGLLQTNIALTIPQPFELPNGTPNQRVANPVLSPPPPNEHPHREPPGSDLSISRVLLVHVRSILVAMKTKGAARTCFELKDSSRGPLPRKSRLQKDTSKMWLNLHGKAHVERPKFTLRIFLSTIIYQCNTWLLQPFVKTCKQISGLLPQSVSPHHISRCPSNVLWSNVVLNGSHSNDGSLLWHRRIRADDCVIKWLAVGCLQLPE